MNSEEILNEDAVGGSELNVQLGNDPYGDNKMVSEKQADILADRAYIAGMLAGWNFGIMEDSEGYEQAVIARRKQD